jgi:hypothetical protein
MAVRVVLKALDDPAHSRGPRDRNAAFRDDRFHSTKLVATNPLAYAVPMALLTPKRE